jgi:hypothetical protein
MISKLACRKHRGAAWTIFCWFLRAKRFDKKYYLLVSLKYMS